MKRSTRHALYAFLAAALACCTTWGRSAPLNRGLLDKHPRLVRVTLADGRHFDVHHAAARGDTLVGDSLGWPQGAGQWRPAYPMAIPFAAVRSVSRRQFSPVRTIVLVVGVTTVVVVIAALSYQGPDVSSMGSGSDCDGGTI